MVLHGGLIHLLLNMFVELRFGLVRTRSSFSVSSSSSSPFLSILFPFVSFIFLPHTTFPLQYLEARWGTLKFCCIFVISSIVGILTSALMRPDSDSVGASAALMGLMGAHTVEILCKWHKTNTLESRMALTQMVMWIVIILLLGLVPLVDTAAHLGGLICGAFLGLTMFAGESNWSRLVQRLLQFSPPVTIVCYVTLCFALLYTIIHPSCAVVSYCSSL
jgi:membrane associated rhomboid family serine protease